MENKNVLEETVKRIASNIDLIGADEAQRIRLATINSNENAIRRNSASIRRIFEALNAVDAYRGQTSNIALETLHEKLNVVLEKELSDIINWETEVLVQLSDEVKNLETQVRSLLESNWNSIKNEINDVLALSRILREDDPTVFGAAIRNLGVFSGNEINPDHMASAIEQLIEVKNLIEKNGADDPDVRQFLINATAEGVSLDDLEKATVKKWLTKNRRELFCVRIKN